MVAGHEPWNEKLYHLCGDEQWDWNKRVQQLEVANEGKEPLDNRRIAKLYVEMHALFSRFAFLLRRFTMPEPSQYRDWKRQDKLGDENLNRE